MKGRSVRPRTKKAEYLTQAEQERRREAQQEREAEKHRQVQPEQAFEQFEKDDGGKFSKSHRMPAGMKFAAPTAVRYNNTTLTACPHLPQSSLSGRKDELKH
jgi:hypothetical protein